MNDQQDKTEQATPHKLEEARKRGQVPHSQELVSVAMTAAFLASFSAIVYQLGIEVISHSHWWLANADRLATGWNYLAVQAIHSIQQISFALMPLIAALIVATVLSNLIFKGVVFSLIPLKPDFKKINPIQGIKKLFSRRLLVETLKTILKGVLFAAVLYYFFKSHYLQLLAIGSLSPTDIPHESIQLMLKLGLSLFFIMLLFVLFDIWYSRYEFARQMKMSHREIKEEYRRREGDPTIRSKQKQIQRELLKKIAALGNVKDADVIITNPTHVAIALQYRPKTMMAPVVLAMGKGMLAKQICQLARKHQVPIIRRPVVARSLLAQCSINAPIPNSTQADVAHIYRWIITLPANKVISI